MTSGAATPVGTQRRLARLFGADGSHTVIVPVDDSLIFGPFGGLEDLETKLRAIADACPDALLGYAGQFEKHGSLLKDLGWIFNVTASTTRSFHTRKQQILSTYQALCLGCDAVAAHVNISSQFEPEMLSTLAAIVAEARQCSVPVLAIMYPRGETTDGHDNNYEALRVDEPDKYTDMVAHAVRIASDLGASMIKTQYTGSTDTFRRVVRAAAPTPVVIAGGPATAVTTALTLAAESIAAGAAGVSFGRNVFGRTDPAPVIRALRAIVHDGLSPTDAATHVELQ